MAKNAVAKTTASDVASFEDLDLDEDVASRDELLIPFYRVLQANSPEVEEGTVEGAKAGMIINNVSKELFDHLDVLMVHRFDAFVEWVPRDQGGGGGKGFVGMHKRASDEVLNAIKENGGTQFGDLRIGKNSLVETFYAYVLVCDFENKVQTGFGVIDFYKTKIKPYKQWISNMQMVTPAQKSFAVFRTRLTTEKQKNEKGSFYNWVVRPANGTNWKDSIVTRPDFDNLLHCCKDMRNMVKAGQAVADFANQGGADPAQDGEAPF